MSTYDLSGRRRASARTWLALVGSAVAVLVLLVMIAVACNPGGDGDPAALNGPSASPPVEIDDDAGGASGGDGDSGDGGPGGSDGGGTPDGDGDGGEPDGDDPGEPDPGEPAPEDCIAYDFHNVSIQHIGGDWRLLVDGASFKLFATEEHAEQAESVVVQHTHRCFIGRGTDREPRSRYIVHYFEGLVLHALPTPIPNHDCISYDPPNLGISFHAEDWWLTDGPAELLPLASQADAERALLVAQDNSRLCYIGRGNDRADHDRYTMSYWLP
jgi:hypothetical protein